MNKLRQGPIIPKKKATNKLLDLDKKTSDLHNIGTQYIDDEEVLDSSSLDLKPSMPPELIINTSATVKKSDSNISLVKKTSS